MPNVLFDKNQIVGITELQRNASSVYSKVKKHDVLILKNNAPCAVMLDYERYEDLVEKAEQAEIYAMLLKRKDNKKWLKTSEVLEGLSFSEGSD
ncbi:MAG: type II toxin-antitoxin system Phd/YefM family antitoxin [Pelotomaculaceae bacterium]|jgi:prevent-host-death family protein|nr:type II toxin-antitoxin system Phd/YefM family antitoxin [Bacillota bacterium]HHU85769.1 type II toxin-antitoxin system Phd/YefM family antitoxin [Peptococcaceae bacterium]